MVVQLQGMVVQQGTAIMQPNRRRALASPPKRDQGRNPGRLLGTPAVQRAADPAVRRAVDPACSAAVFFVAPLLSAPAPLAPRPPPGLSTGASLPANAGPARCRAVDHPWSGWSASVERIVVSPRGATRDSFSPKPPPSLTSSRAGAPSRGRWFAEGTPSREDWLVKRSRFSRLGGLVALSAGCSVELFTEDVGVAVVAGRGHSPGCAD